MGVPPKTNPKWLKEIAKYQTDEYDCEKLKKEDQRMVKIAFDPKTMKCDSKMSKRAPHLPVYKIPIKKLYFNAYSARLGQFADTAIGLNQEITGNKKIIKNALISERKEFLGKMKLEGQMIPAIALADGVLVDGNRRMAFLMEAGIEDLYVVFLPKEIKKLEAAKLEAYYSNQSDGKLEYDKLKQGKQWSDWKKDYGNVDGLLDALSNITKEKIEQRIRSYELARQYAKSMGWYIPKTRSVNVDRINDTTKKAGGPGYTIFEDRIETSLPLGTNRDKFAMVAFCLLRGWIDNDEDGGVDRPIDGWKKCLKNAKTKNELLKDCKLLQKGQLAKWNTDEMYREVLDQVMSKGAGAGGSGSSVSSIGSALKNLRKVKKKDLKKTDTDTQTKLKQVQALVKEYLGKWKSS